MKKTTNRKYNLYYNIFNNLICKITTVFNEYF